MQKLSTPTGLRIRITETRRLSRVNARVSTGDQDVALQRDALTVAGCYRVFVDTASGALDARPALADVLDQLRPEDTSPRSCDGSSARQASS